MLNRPSFACFHEVYEITRTAGHANDHLPIKLPGAVLQELLSFVLLAPFLEVEFDKPWGDELIATDASDAFGFGVSVASVGASASASLSRAAVGPGRYVHIAGDEAAPAGSPRARAGAPVSLPISRSAFRSVISSRRRFAGHSGALEAAAFSLGLRWLLRAGSRHGLRQVFLIDATAVQGAVRKGRSSAPSIRREISRIAALTLAGGLNITYLYVPSEFNPADDPSRGVVVPRRRRLSAVRAWARARLDPAPPVPIEPTSRRGGPAMDVEWECKEFARRFPEAWAFWDLDDDAEDEEH